MPTTGVAQWTCTVSNLGFIYIYGLNNLPLLLMGAGGLVFEENDTLRLPWLDVLLLLGFSSSSSCCSMESLWLRIHSSSLDNASMVCWKLSCAMFNWNKKGYSKTFSLRVVGEICFISSNSWQKKKTRSTEDKLHILCPEAAGGGTENDLHQGPIASSYWPVYLEKNCSRLLHSWMWWWWTKL